MRKNTEEFNVIKTAPYNNHCKAINFFYAVFESSQNSEQNVLGYMNWKLFLSVGITQHITDLLECVCKVKRTFIHECMNEIERFILNHSAVRVIVCGASGRKNILCKSILNILL